MQKKKRTRTSVHSRSGSSGPETRLSERYDELLVDRRTGVVFVLFSSHGNSSRSFPLKSCRTSIGKCSWATRVFELELTTSSKTYSLYFPTKQVLYDTFNAVCVAKVLEWRRNGRRNSLGDEERQCWAAMIIQAVYRGYRERLESWKRYRESEYTTFSICFPRLSARLVRHASPYSYLSLEELERVLPARGVLFQKLKDARDKTAMSLLLVHVPLPVLLEPLLLPRPFVQVHTRSVRVAELLRIRGRRSEAICDVKGSSSTVRYTLPAIGNTAGVVVHDSMFAQRRKELAGAGNDILRGPWFADRAVSECCLVRIASRVAMQSSRREDAQVAHVEGDRVIPRTFCTDDSDMSVGMLSAREGAALPRWDRSGVASKGASFSPFDFVTVVSFATNRQAQRHEFQFMTLSEGTVPDGNAPLFWTALCDPMFDNLLAHGGGSEPRNSSVANGQQRRRPSVALLITFVNSSTDGSDDSTSDGVAATEPSISPRMGSSSSATVTTSALVIPTSSLLSAIHRDPGALVLPLDNFGVLFLGSSVVEVLARVKETFDSSHPVVASLRNEAKRRWAIRSRLIQNERMRFLELRGADMVSDDGKDKWSGVSSSAAAEVDRSTYVRKSGMVQVVALGASHSPPVAVWCGLKGGMLVLFDSARMHVCVAKMTLSRCLTDVSRDETDAFMVESAFVIRYREGVPSDDENESENANKPMGMARFAPHVFATEVNRSLTIVCASPADMASWLNAVIAETYEPTVNAQEMENAAALCIQRVWRGHRVRRVLFARVARLFWTQHTWSVVKRLARLGYLRDEMLSTSTKKASAVLSSVPPSGVDAITEGGEDAAVDSAPSGFMEGELETLGASKAAVREAHLFSQRHRELALLIRKISLMDYSVLCRTRQSARLSVYITSSPLQKLPTGQKLQALSSVEPLSLFVGLYINNGVLILDQGGQELFVRFIEKDEFTGLPSFVGIDPMDPTQNELYLRACLFWAALIVCGQAVDWRQKPGVAVFIRGQWKGTSERSKVVAFDCTSSLSRLIEVIRRSGGSNVSDDFVPTTDQLVSESVEFIDIQKAISRSKRDKRREDEKRTRADPTDVLLRAFSSSFGSVFFHPQVGILLLSKTVGDAALLVRCILDARSFSTRESGTTPSSAFPSFLVLPWRVLRPDWTEVIVSAEETDRFRHERASVSASGSGALVGTTPNVLNAQKRTTKAFLPIIQQDAGRHRGPVLLLPQGLERMECWGVVKGGALFCYESNLEERILRRIPLRNVFVDVVEGKPWIHIAGVEDSIPSEFFVRSIPSGGASQDHATSVLVNALITERFSPSVISDEFGHSPAAVAATRIQSAFRGYRARVDAWKVVSSRLVDMYNQSFLGIDGVGVDAQRTSLLLPTFAERGRVGFFLRHMRNNEKSERAERDRDLARSSFVREQAAVKMAYKEVMMLPSFLTFGRQLAKIFAFHAWRTSQHASFEDQESVDLETMALKEGTSENLLPPARMRCAVRWSVFDSLESAGSSSTVSSVLTQLGLSDAVMRTDGGAPERVLMNAADERCAHAVFGYDVVCEVRAMFERRAPENRMGEVGQSSWDMYEDESLFSSERRGPDEQEHLVALEIDRKGSNRLACVLYDSKTVVLSAWGFTPPRMFSLFALGQDANTVVDVLDRFCLSQTPIMHHDLSASLEWMTRPHDRIWIRPRRLATSVVWRPSLTVTVTPVCPSAPVSGTIYHQKFCLSASSEYFLKNSDGFLAHIATTREGEMIERKRAQERIKQLSLQEEGSQQLLQEDGVSPPVGGEEERIGPASPSRRRRIRGWRSTRRRQATETSSLEDESLLVPPFRREALRELSERAVSFESSGSVMIDGEWRTCDLVLQTEDGFVFRTRQGSETLLVDGIDVRPAEDLHKSKSCFTIHPHSLLGERQYSFGVADNALRASWISFLGRASIVARAKKVHAALQIQRVWKGNCVRRGLRAVVIHFFAEGNSTMPLFRLMARLCRVLLVSQEKKERSGAVLAMGPSISDSPLSVSLDKITRLFERRGMELRKVVSRMGALDLSPLMTLSEPSRVALLPSLFEDGKDKDGSSPSSSPSGKKDKKKVVTSREGENETWDGVVYAAVSIHVFNGLLYRDSNGEEFFLRSFAIDDGVPVFPGQVEDACEDVRMGCLCAATSLLYGPSKLEWVKRPSVCVFVRWSTFPDPPPLGLEDLKTTSVWLDVCFERQFQALMRSLGDAPYPSIPCFVQHEEQSSAQAVFLSNSFTDAESLFAGVLRFLSGSGSRGPGVEKMDAIPTSLIRVSKKSKGKKDKAQKRLTMQANRERDLTRLEYDRGFALQKTRGEAPFLPFEWSAERGLLRLADTKPFAGRKSGVLSKRIGTVWKSRACFVRNGKLEECTTVDGYCRLVASYPLEGSFVDVCHSFESKPKKRKGQKKAKKEQPPTTISQIVDEESSRVEKPEKGAPPFVMEIRYSEDHLSHHAHMRADSIQTVSTSSSLDEEAELDFDLPLAVRGQQKQGSVLLGCESKQEMESWINALIAEGFQPSTSLSSLQDRSREKFYCAVTIQKAFRGFQGRVMAASLALDRWGDHNSLVQRSTSAFDALGWYHEKAKSSPSTASVAANELRERSRSRVGDGALSDSLRESSRSLIDDECGVDGVMKPFLSTRKSLLETVEEFVSVNLVDAGDDVLVASLVGESSILLMNASQEEKFVKILHSGDESQRVEHRREFSCDSDVVIPEEALAASKGDDVPLPSFAGITFDGRPGELSWYRAALGAWFGLVVCPQRNLWKERPRVMVIATMAPLAKSTGDGGDGGNALSMRRVLHRQMQGFFRYFSSHPFPSFSVFRRLDCVVLFARDARSCATLYRQATEQTNGAQEVSNIALVLAERGIVRAEKPLERPTDGSVRFSQLSRSSAHRRGQRMSQTEAVLVLQSTIRRHQACLRVWEYVSRQLDERIHRRSVFCAKLAASVAHAAAVQESRIEHRNQVDDRERYLVGLFSVPFDVAAGDATDLPAHAVISPTEQAESIIAGFVPTLEYLVRVDSVLVLLSSLFFSKMRRSDNPFNSVEEVERVRRVIERLNSHILPLLRRSFRQRSVSMIIPVVAVLRAYKPLDAALNKDDLSASDVLLKCAADTARQHYADLVAKDAVTAEGISYLVSSVIQEMAELDRVFGVVFSSQEDGISMMASTLAESVVEDVGNLLQGEITLRSFELVASAESLYDSFAKEGYSLSPGPLQSLVTSCVHRWVDGVEQKLMEWTKNAVKGAVWVAISNTRLHSEALVDVFSPIVTSISSIKDIRKTVGRIELVWSDSLVTLSKVFAKAVELFVNGTAGAGRAAIEQVSGDVSLPQDFCVVLSTLGATALHLQELVVDLESMAERFESQQVDIGGVFSPCFALLKPTLKELLSASVGKWLWPSLGERLSFPPEDPPEVDEEENEQAAQISIQSYSIRTVTRVFAYLDSALDKPVHALSSPLFKALLRHVLRALVEHWRVFIINEKEKRVGTAFQCSVISRVSSLAVEYFHASGEGLSRSVMEREVEPLRQALKVASLPLEVLLATPPELAESAVEVERLMAVVSSIRRKQESTRRKDLAKKRDRERERQRGILRRERELAKSERELQKKQAVVAQKEAEFKRKEHEDETRRNFERMQSTIFAVPGSAPSQGVSAVDNGNDGKERRSRDHEEEGTKPTEISSAGSEASFGEGAKKKKRHLFGRKKQH